MGHCSALQTLHRHRQEDGTTASPTTDTGGGTQGERMANPASVWLCKGRHLGGGQALVLPQGTRTPGPALLAVTNSTCSNNTSPGHTAEVNSSQPEPELRMEGRAKHGLSPSPASGSSPHGSVHVNRPCAGVLAPSSCGVLAACPAACTGLMSVVSPRTERCYHGPLSERSPAWKIGWCEIRMHLG